MVGFAPLNPTAMANYEAVRMDTRVTLQTAFNRAIVDTRRLTDQIADLQTQSATGKRYQRISDNPAATLSVLANSAQERTMSAHLANIGVARSALNTSVSTLQQASTIFTRAHSIATDAANSANDASSYEAIASEVDEMINQLLSLANTKQAGTYLYGGEAGTQPPFAVSATDSQGRPTAITYNGSDDRASASVGQHQQVAVYYAGNDVFQSRDRGAVAFSGNTGAVPGPGTNTATARASLTFTHTTTTYAAGSGVKAGSSSAAGDTILGPAGTHRLQIVDTSGSGAFGTISLDGGAPISFTSSDGNLKLNSPNGDAVYVDTTAITAGFNGSVDITANGTMSIDGGATSTPVTFASDQFATDGATGKTTFVDTTNVKRVGSERIDYAGAYDSFQALIALRDDLRNTNNLSHTDQIQAVANHIGEIDRAQNKLLDKVGQQSATLSTLDSLDSHLQDLQLTVKQTVSDLQDADMTDIVVKMQAYNQMLQLSLASYARIIDTNLLDFLK